MVGRTIAVWVLAAVVAMGVLGCKKKQPADLVLVSPHSQFVEQEFEKAFQAWHQQKYGQPVKLEWRNVGGGTQITQFLVAQYTNAQSSGIDIYFGGGGPDHVDLGSRGLLEKITLAPEILRNLPAEIGGVQQYDAQAGWYGACLASFGIIYNAKLVAEDKLPAPRSWDDLGNPRMFGLTCAAGHKSSSARACYELMLQTAPDWPSGWRRLLTFWANCKQFPQNAGDVPGMVAKGEVLAGTCIDYYAFIQMEGKQAGMLKFLIPAGGAVFTPDPISVLKGAPHRQMAERFMEFVLSEPGQALWCLPAGTPGGPQSQALYRQPIRKDTYQTYKGKMLEQLVNPFEAAGDFKMDAKLQAARVSHILPVLMQAAAEDNTDRLHEAWKVIIDKGQPADLMAEFTALPANLATIEALLATAEQLAGKDEKVNNQILSDWRAFFRAKYEKIAEKK